jgi:hypothetical protein
MQSWSFCFGRHFFLKKWRYWPKHLPGKAMDERMMGLQFGDTAAIEGGAAFFCNSQDDDHTAYATRYH